MRPVWGVGLAVVVGALAAPGSAAAADCNDPGTDLCSIVADNFVVAPNPVAVGQLMTFTATVHSEAANSVHGGTAAANVEYKFEPDFAPGDDPGDVQSATVSSQPPAPRNTWSCTSPPVEPVVCHGPLNATDSVTFKAVYKATGATREAFMDLHMTSMQGEVEDFCPSGGGPFNCDDNDEDGFTSVQISGPSSPGGGQAGGGGGSKPSVFDVIPPAFLGSSIKPRVFFVGTEPMPVSVGKKKAKQTTGTQIVYTLSEAGTVTMVIERKLNGRRVKRRCRRITHKNRKKRRCVLYAKKGTLTRRAPAGTTVLPWSGRIGNRKLLPARYRMTLVAVDAAGNRSPPRRVYFRIKKPKTARKH
jgi:hypothetical protein